MLDGTKPRLTSRGRRPSRSVPFLFLVIEAGRPTGGSARFSLEAVDELVIGRGTERAAVRSVAGGGRRLEVRVPDPWMSRANTRIARRGAELAISDLGSFNGTLVDGAPVTSAPLRDGAVLELGHTTFVVRRAPVEGDAPDVLDGATIDAAIATVVPQLEERLNAVAQVARSTVSIVLRGPSGAGKDVLAAALHRLSGRTGPLVAVNCGAVPDELVESELFGHRRGAFSGALSDKVGLVAAADRGTLFLDEIGDLPLVAQPALLRALQDRAIRPVGATATTPVDFRVVCATHKPVEAMIQRGELREDLWARLSGLTVELPPLAERREDLGTLVASLVAKLAPDREVTLTPDAARALVAHRWPRNVRELEKVLESALALAGDGDVDLAHLPRELGQGVARSGAHPPAPDASADVALDPALAPALAPAPDDDPRRAELVAALRAHGGNVSAVARALGKQRAQIQRWMRRWGLRGQ